MIGKVLPQSVHRAGYFKKAGAIDHGWRSRFQKGRLNYGREDKRRLIVTEKWMESAR